MRPLGVHTSITGGLHLSVKRAFELGCECFQIFTHSPRGWKKRILSQEEITKFKQLRTSYEISPCFVHSSYLINLASRDDQLWQRSIELMIYEVQTAEKIGADAVVFHPGRAAGQAIKDAIKRAVGALKVVCSHVPARMLIIENTAGQRGELGSTIHQLAGIIESLPENCFHGICVDTAHAFASGYDLRSPEAVDAFASEIKKMLYPLPVSLLHVNDTKSPLGGRLDRHEHIGRGNIGIQGFSTILHHPFFSNTPLILETPKNSDEDDRRNLQIVRGLLSTGGQETPCKD